VTSALEMTSFRTSEFKERTVALVIRRAFGADSMPLTSGEIRAVRVPS